MADKVFKGEMFFSNDLGQGWAEGVYLKGDDYAACLARIKLLITARSFLMAANVTLDYAVVTKQQITIDGAKNPADGKCAQSGPLLNPHFKGNLAAVPPVLVLPENLTNDAGYGPLCRFETESSGLKVNTIFRGIPDKFIIGQKLSHPIPPPIIGPLPEPIGADDIGVRLAFYMAAFVTNCQHVVIKKRLVRQNNRKFVISDFLVEEFTSSFYRKISSRKLGKRFDLSRGRRKAVA